MPQSADTEGPDLVTWIYRRSASMGFADRFQAIPLPFLANDRNAARAFGPTSASWLDVLIDAEQVLRGPLLLRGSQSRIVVAEARLDPRFPFVDPVSYTHLTLPTNREV